MAQLAKKKKLPVRLRLIALTVGHSTRMLVVTLVTRSYLRDSDEALRADYE
jgi:hypothetical protein